MIAAAALILATLGDPLEFAVTSELGELDDAVREQVAARVEGVASSLEHEPADGAAHKLTISVEWIEGSQTDFLVTLSTSHGDEDPLVGTFECRECSATELLDRTEAHARTAIERLFESADDEDEEPPAPTAPPPAEAPPSPPARKKLGPLGWAGIASLGVGTSGIIAGSIFLSIGEARLKSDPTSLRDFRPAGYATLGVGGAALITGTVLLIVDRRRARSTDTAFRVTPSSSGIRIAF